MKFKSRHQLVNIFLGILISTCCFWGSVCASALQSEQLNQATEIIETTKASASADIPADQVASKATILALNSQFNGVVPASYIEYLVANSQQLKDFNALLQSELQNELQNKDLKWQSFTNITRLDPNQWYWFRVRIRSDLASKSWLFSPGYWHESELYYQQDSKWQSYDLSAFLPLEKRTYPSSRPMVKLLVNQPQSTLYLKSKGFRQGRKPLAQRLKILDETQFQQELIEAHRVQAGYLGFAIGIACFHFILWLWFRERVYLWLVVAMVSSPIFFHAFYGFGLTHLWPNWPVWNEYSASLLAAIAPAFYLKFGIVYLNLSITLSKICRLLHFLIYGLVVSSVAVFYHESNLLWIQALITSFASALLLFSSIYLAYKGYRYAWYFIAGNFAILVALFIWTLIELQLLGWDDLAFSIVDLAQFGSAWQGTLLALGMVERMQSMRQIMLKQALEAEKEALQHAQQTRALIQAQNEELESSNKALKELDDLKDDFLARTSHELNTPLNGIIGLSQLLLDKELIQSEKERTEYLEIIASRAEHLKDLVSELLEFVKVRKDVITLYPEEINVASHIRKIILTFKTQAEQKELTLIGPEQESVMVNADARRLRQCLTILLDNAIKYTDEGSIKVAVFDQSEQIVISVADTGIGIKSDLIASIFEPFKQLEYKNKTREGAGLGLSICKQLVELHRGVLSIESTENVGSTFSITLPKNSRDC
ncbi:sensor histidine kinase [Aliikangiella sp. IMCC44632]